MKNKIWIYIITVVVIIFSINYTGTPLKKDFNKNIRFQIDERHHNPPIFENDKPHMRFHMPPPENPDFPNPHSKPIAGFLAIFIIVLSSAYAYAIQYSKREQHINSLENERLQSELLFLKTQINPHFLFNVLNSVYALSLQESKKLPDIILKLSDILRYMTYESQETFVNIQKEIDYISSYIELQKLRFKDSGFIQLEITNSNETAEIAPLILIPFIENAFKHGYLIAEKSYIHIHVATYNNAIQFEIKNSILTNIQKDSGKGIGIQNVKRRLDLLYPNMYQLDIIPNEHEYSVKLLIKI